jgi:hypothetical protein
VSAVATAPRRCEACGGEQGRDVVRRRCRRSWCGRQVGACCARVAARGDRRGATICVDCKAEEDALPRPRELQPTASLPELDVLWGGALP